MKRPLKKYAIALYEALQEPGVKASDVFRRFIAVLKKDSVMKDAEKILTLFRSYWNTRERVVDVIATTKHPLSSVQKKEIGSTVMKTFGAEHCAFEERIDPAVLGGVVLRVGDTLVDGSVRRQLSVMKEAMRQ